MRLMYVALATFVVLGHPVVALECYMDCSVGMLCPQTCNAGHNGCLAVFKDVAGEIESIVFRCGTFDSQDCQRTTCDVRSDTVVHACCCNHPYCNYIKGLESRIMGTPPPPPPTPTVTPPPEVPGQTLCEIYNCTVHPDDCYHGYQMCNGVCHTVYRTDVRLNYNVYELGCSPFQPDGVTESDVCTLDTAGRTPEVSCYCTGYLCNAITNLAFTDRSIVVDFIDMACEAIECSHGCVRTLQNGPFCLCEEGYILDSGGQKCVDLNECNTSRNTCEEQCINLDGTFECTCTSPKLLAEDGRSCYDSGGENENGVGSCPDPPKLSEGCGHVRLGCTHIYKATLTSAVEPNGQVCMGENGRPIGCESEDIAEQACHNFYRLDPNNALILILPSCLAKDRNCLEDRCLVMPLDGAPDHYSCCCYGSYECNRNPDFSQFTYTTTTTVTMETITDNSTVNNTASPLKMSHVAAGVVSVVISLVVLCCILLAVFLFKWRNRAQRKNVKKLMDLPLGSEVEVGSTEIDHRTVTILDTTVGAGRFGSVHRGHSSDPSYTMELAIKVFKPNGKSSFEREREIYKLTHFHHPNILQYLGSREEPTRWIITVYHGNGSLNSVLKLGHEISPLQCHTLLITLTKGLVFLEERKISHRDIKSSNVLVGSEFESIISDFGLAVLIPNEDSPQDGGWEQIHEQVGTPRYMAPEILEGTINISSPTVYLMMDMYSSALVMWEILSRTKSCPDIVLPQYSPPYSRELCEMSINSTTPSIHDMMDLFEKNSEVRPIIPLYLQNDMRYKHYIDIISYNWSSEPNARRSATGTMERFSEYSDSGVECSSSSSDSHPEAKTARETTV